MSITLTGMKNVGERVQRILDTYHANIEPPRQKGVKPFQVGNQTVWALNMKNATRKAKLYPDQEVIGG